MRTLGSRIVVPAFGLVAILGLAVNGQTQAPAKPKAAPPQQNRDLDGKYAPKSLMTAEGVITSLEMAGEPVKGKPRTRKIELNQDVVWRDFVRDQAAVEDVQRANIAAAAEKGKKSVATLGQPKSANNTTVVEIPPSAKIETRFRSSTDEATEGSLSPGRAGATEKAEDAFDKEAQKEEKSAPKPKANPSPKAPGTQLSDLKTGLFVELEYSDKGGKNVASRVRILRPVGGPNTSADEARPGSPEKASGKRKAK